MTCDRTTRDRYGLFPLRTTQSTYFRLYLTENISGEFYISSDHISLQEPNSCLHDSLFLTT